MTRRRNRRVRSRNGGGAALGLWRSAQRAMRSTLTVLLAAAALAGATVGVYAGVRALSASKRLTVQHIRISGLVRAGESEVLTYAGLSRGQSIWGLDLDAIALRVLRHPWVESATVRRRFPDTVTVDVKEFEPSLLVSLGGLYVADARAELFKRFSARDGLALPVLTGLSADDVSERPERVHRVLKEGVELVRAIDQRRGALGQLEEVHWDALLGFSVVSQLAASDAPATAVRVHLGSHAVGRLGLAVDALVAVRASGRVPAVIWVDGVKEPRRVHVRFGAARALWDQEPKPAGSDVPVQRRRDGLGDSIQPRVWDKARFGSYVPKLGVDVGPLRYTGSVVQTADGLIVRRRAAVSRAEMRG